VDGVFAIRWDGAQPRVLQPEGKGAKPKAQVFTALPEHPEQEQWILRKDVRSDTYAIVHQSSSLALTLSGEGPAVILDVWNDSDDQRWQLLD
jgi:hypothetical protein